MKILFVCTHNRCRSILSESITNHLAKEKHQAFSAGSHPEGKVHPFSLKYLAEKDYSTDGLKSKSWEVFQHQPLDLVITVCDSAAQEACPIWCQDIPTRHWSLPDPSQRVGTEQEIRSAFFEVINTIEQRVPQLFHQLLE